LNIPPALTAFAVFYSNHEITNIWVYKSLPVNFSSTEVCHPAKFNLRVYTEDIGSVTFRPFLHQPILIIIMKFDLPGSYFLTLVRTLKVK